MEKQIIQNAETLYESLKEFRKLDKDISELYRKKEDAYTRFINEISKDIQEKFPIFKFRKNNGNYNINILFSTSKVFEKERKRGGCIGFWGVLRMPRNDEGIYIKFFYSSKAGKKEAQKAENYLKNINWDLK
ncbi:hypothetical protein [uncultured Campylobacter sp.]|uniref:hypothetical protein n=1 Tax=uncultured Campylobacter sp. TaxID=218934 RepID=UPI0026273441|nr:hypothetical protein [uncultured Campylobacter sp.]